MTKSLAGRGREGIPQRSGDPLPSSCCRFHLVTSSSQKNGRKSGEVRSKELELKERESLLGVRE